VASTIDADGTLLVFDTSPGGRGAIEISAKPDKPGLVRGTIRVDGRIVPVTQLIWP
jgi:hypothetical protein